jgi:hypothetical protein
LLLGLVGDGKPKRDEQAQYDQEACEREGVGVDLAGLQVEDSGYEDGDLRRGDEEGAGAPPVLCGTACEGSALW